MKNLSTILSSATLTTATLLVFSTFSLQSVASTTMVRPSTTTDYTMKEFDISPDSQVLPKSEDISNATVSVDKAQKTVTLTVYHHMFCPAGHFCSMLMPAPLKIELPLTYIGHGFCGGTIITATQDNRSADGSLTEIEIYDDNGNNCNPNQSYDKSVNVTISEQSFGEIKPTVSKMIGFPSPINYLDNK